MSHYNILVGVKTNWIRVSVFVFVFEYGYGSDTDRIGYLLKKYI